MKSWRVVLLLVVVVVIAAFTWTWLAADPGEVQIRIRHMTIDTSVVVAAVLVLVAWAVMAACWKLARWPFRAWGRNVKRRGRGQLVGGLTALTEGEYVIADRDLGRAANHAAFRTPALLGLARVAHERGASDRATGILDGVDARGTRAADTLRAQFLMDNAQESEALAFLKPKAATNDLSPRGWRLLIDAALATGDTQTAMEALPNVTRSLSLTSDTKEALERRVLAEALRAAPDEPGLKSLWNSASRAQRRRPELIAAFARRSAAIGQTLAAMDEIESAQRRTWNDELATCYADLGSAELPARAARAEAWQAIAPNSAALLTTIGRLYVQQGLWSKAEDPLQRSLAIAELPLAWETLGDSHLGEGDSAAANRCYSNALRLGRREATVPVGTRLPRAPVDTHPITFEERSEHGVPRLPGTR